jgi:hypothetical protein
MSNTHFCFNITKNPHVSTWAIVVSFHLVLGSLLNLIKFFINALHIEML